MTEEFGFEQRFLGEGTAINRSEGAIRSRRVVMDQARDQFLAGPGLTLDQCRGRGGSDPDGIVDHVAEGAGDGDDVAVGEFTPDLGSQLVILVDQLGLLDVHELGHRTPLQKEIREEVSHFDRGALEDEHAMDARGLAQGVACNISTIYRFMEIADLAREFEIGLFALAGFAIADDFADLAVMTDDHQAAIAEQAITTR